MAALSNMRGKWRHHQPGSAAGPSTTVQVPTTAKRATTTKRPRATKRATTTKTRIENPTAMQKQATKAIVARHRQGQKDQEEPEKRPKKSAKLQFFLSF